MAKPVPGTQPLLDVVPDHLHMRTPLIIGSPENVALVESFIQPTPANATVTQV